MMSLAILLPTLLGLWLHRRIGPDRATALFVIGGFVLRAVGGIALYEHREHRAHLRRFHRALDKLACSHADDAVVALFPSIDVIVTKDAAFAIGREPTARLVRLVDAQNTAVIELRLDGTSSPIVRDPRARDARTAILVAGTTVQRVALRRDPRCPRT